MNKTFKDGLFLLLISWICTIALFIPHFLCDGFGLLPFSNSYYDGIFYLVCLVVELIVFTIVGCNKKFSFSSLMVFLVISLLLGILSAFCAGEWISEALVNAITTNYPSFAKNLVFPFCETIFKSVVLLISRAILIRKSK